MRKASTYIVAVRDETSSGPALARAMLMAVAGDRVVIAHARRQALLGLLGLLAAGAQRGSLHEDSVAALVGDDWLDDLRQRVEAPHGVAVESALLDGEPALALCALASRLGASAIVAAPARAGALREMIIGSTLLRVLRHAPCPVVVARHAEAGRWRSATAAVTADPTGERVIDAAHALLPDATLTLLHAWQVPDEGRLRVRGMAQAGIDSVRAYVRNSAEAALAPLRARAGDALLELHHGHASTVILEWGLQERPDLLLIAAHRGAHSEERVLGSVTQFVLYHWPGDLLLVP
jgi:nucleotide-binding universal stress UspA family protein